MTPEEKKQFFEGASAPGVKGDERVAFRRIPEDTAARQAHMDRVTARDAEALGGIRAIIDQAPAQPPGERGMVYGEALAQSMASRISPEAGAVGMSGKTEHTAIVERPRSWREKLFGKKHSRE